jgi:ABC-type glycerol-3-phosphate transport system permease component
MRFMEEQKNFFAESKEAVEKYLQDRLLLLQLQTTEKISKLIAAMFASLLIAILGFFILLFLSIMAGYYFASLTGSNFLGFGIVAAFYLILLGVIVAIRKNVIQKNIINMVIEVMFEKTKEEEEENENKE